MAKYINKDDVYEWLVAHLPKHQERIEQILNDVPSIDIVYCKDCKYYKPPDCLDNFHWTCELINRIREETDYCSYGEQREKK